MLQNRLCSAGALLVMVFLPSSASASPIGAGTRGCAIRGGAAARGAVPADLPSSGSGV